MNEADLIAAWSTARMQIVRSQLAPTFLLAVSVVLFVMGVAQQPLAVRLALAGILLASGILGAVVQITAATEALAAAGELARSSEVTAVGRAIAAQRWTMTIVRVVTPVVFVLVFAAELWALFSA